ncbi:MULTISPECIES: diaminopropionate ammonia-lyase [Clostridia]|jgi:diaminopropionate ammonia-lyase|uniref:diaminopropionate ammonia-lyase n=1 Tax=Clostridia TaxID=186801 RepID=UPI000E5022F3|nr:MULTISPECIES: diaminopropionate ammonia-lyase [Clostridia]RGH38365.1 diaminopropionate ammonia-lyase [Firmicutes bacterium AM41-5BH]RHV03160.1 diaminopropionate ammonia-lyase [Firmicutes bacterium OM07-11]RKQ26884.1 diaminopropionate ammonia-lyase [Ruminococcus sp. B05]TAP32081.1 diaminopropionate ammonia-lyase [Mediterraneibacter sp. gm002]
MESIKWAVNKMPKTNDENLKVMSLEEVKKARAFHESFPQYTVTPLTKLDKMADMLGLGEVYIKDESYRFGLNAFKVLGGSFAMARYIAKQTGKDVSELPYNVLTSDALKEEFGQATFFTATDGNHGRGVAWAANKLGQKAVVLMPKGTTQTRLNNILAEGATATIEEYNYDECVRMANDMAMKTENGIMVQDTAWDGYEEIPAWIMQGYGTMAMEAYDQLQDYGCERPTHVFIQAGVGSLAGAVQGYFANRYPENPPKVVVVEAEAAACLYKGASVGDGSIQIVDGDMVTIMAGLACGEPNTISWDILKNHVDTFISTPDWVAAKGMRMLAAPIKGDKPVTSGESGAAPFGTLACIMMMDEYKELREHLGLDENSKVLLFSTEGNTDPERYESIVWDGNEK